MTFCSRCIQWNGQLCLPMTLQSDTLHSTDLCSGECFACVEHLPPHCSKFPSKQFMSHFELHPLCASWASLAPLKNSLSAWTLKTNNTWVSGSLLMQIYPGNKIIWAVFWVVALPDFGPAKNEQSNPIIQGFDKTVFKMGWIWKWLVFLHRYLH